MKRPIQTIQPIQPVQTIQRSKPSQSYLQHLAQACNLLISPLHLGLHGGKAGIHRRLVLLAGTQLGLQLPHLGPEGND